MQWLRQVCQSAERALAGDPFEDELKAVDKEIKDIVNASADFARESPEPALEELWTDIYADVVPQEAV